jgi:hypothetical protein
MDAYDKVSTSSAKCARYTSSKQKSTADLTDPPPPTREAKVNEVDDNDELDDPGAISKPRSPSDRIKKPELVVDAAATC